MGNLNGAPQQGYAPPAAAAGDNLQEFFDEVEQIRSGIEKVNANIATIESLHQRSLNEVDEGSQQNTQHRLEALVSETSSLNNSLAGRIKILKGKASRDPGKSPQVGVLDRNFKDTLRKYQMVEKTFADRTREQMARQYRIVRPDATEEEVRQACEDSQGQQIFSQALLTGNRRGEAGSALREVQARHNEIQRIEKTIIELAQLFNEMEQLVTEQETMVENIDQRGEEITQNVDKAQNELENAVEKARSARRKKWWCLLIVCEFSRISYLSDGFVLLWCFFFFCRGSLEIHPAVFFP
ncbi:t-SNARE [Sphaerosporella brunnea]|uniref:t-SNARE n=1 Tax=Sphaerosporella brunnea TaxID=1250544 RepID=A0A5J5EIK6_9PEZI|nr:t-SNARE [Sphaerosporella brunnea]